MNAPGFMQDDKHNRYLTDEELDALLPTSGYAIVTPPPGYAPAVAPRKFQSTPVTTIGGFEIKEGSDAAAMAAAAGLAPELPTEIPASGTLHSLRRRTLNTLPPQNQEWHSSCP